MNLLLRVFDTEMGKIHSHDYDYESDSCCGYESALIHSHDYESQLIHSHDYEPA